MAFNLFSKQSKETKLKEIENLKPQELLSILSIEILERILKETGEGEKGKRARKFNLSGKTGNSWNSWIEGISRTTSGDVYVWVYIQYGNTDTSQFILAKDFFCSGDYQGKVEYRDSHGGTQTSYYTYTPEVKADVIREIFKLYVEKKYK